MPSLRPRPDLTAPATVARAALPLIDLAPPAADLHRDVLDGLAQRPRSLPCKYFYDDVGSQLFESITQTSINRDPQSGRMTFELFLKFKGAPAPAKK